MLFYKTKHVYVICLRIFLSIVLLAVLTSCTQFLFQPQRVLYATPDRFGVIYEDVEFETAEGLRLHGWKLLAQDKVRATVLFFHGNGENISSHFINVHWLTESGYDVYLFDYQGYGRSEGFAQLDAVISNTKSMIAFTVDQLEENEKLIVMGHSLGASLSIYAVANSEYKNRIATLVSVEAFSDYHEVTQDVLSTSWLTWLLQWPLSFTVDNSYRPLDSVANIAPVPLMLMHSKDDAIIPFEHSQALYDAAVEPKKLQPVVGGHNVIFNNTQNRELLLQYLDGL